MIPTRTAEDLIAGHWQLLRRFGAVPRELVWDQEGAVGAWRRGKPALTEAFEAFRGMLGTSVRLCRARRPQAKGLVERNNDYFERSFLPGRVFTSPADFNTQIREWITSRANVRHHRASGCQPIARWAADKAAISHCPRWNRRWAGGIRCACPGTTTSGWMPTTTGGPAGDRPPGRGARRSAPRAGLRCRALVAEHVRCWAAHQSVTDPAHAAAAVALRAAGRPPRESEDADQVEVRDLSALRPGVRRGRAGGLMPAVRAASRDLTAEIAYLTRALKAPTLRESVDRLVERATAESWSYPEFLAACLQREVSARESHGGEGRIRAARFPARKTLEEFDFDHARGLKREQIAHLAPWTSSPPATTWCSSARPAPARPTVRLPEGVQAMGASGSLVLVWGS